MKVSADVDILDPNQQVKTIAAAIIIQAYEDIKKFALHNRRNSLPRDGFSVFLSAVGYFESEEFDTHCDVLDLDADALFAKVKKKYGEDIADLLGQWKRGEINEDITRS